MLTFLIWFIGSVGIGYLSINIGVSPIWAFPMGLIWGMLVVWGHEKIVNRHNRNIK